MDMCGGRTVSEDRSRRRKWKWMNYANTPTTFKHIHLSLNQNIGVRVQGQESVFVTFLASGQQARFNVGSCTKVQYVYFLSNFLRHDEGNEFTEQCVCVCVHSRAALLRLCVQKT